MPGCQPGIEAARRHPSDCRLKPGSEELRDRMSELDKVFAELAQRRAQRDEERRGRMKVAVAFLTEFYEADIKPSQTLRNRGIDAQLVDNRLVLHKPQSGACQEPLQIVAGEQGEIDVGGKSLGRYQPTDKLAKKRELIGEIISFFDL
jgi:hypothetical protein